MAPTAKVCAVVAVPAWSPNQPHPRNPRHPAEHKKMSDADTEGSTEATLWRDLSITSSESDGPRIVVHSTSEDEDPKEITLEAVTLLRVGPPESVTTTDIGSDNTSDGAESSHESGQKDISPELTKALVSQLEEYLSDEGLAKDLFLLKHVKRHRNGFVSLKLLSGYKKIKKLSRDWRVISTALRTSEKLQLNDAYTKVRRRNPLPTTLQYEAPSSRSLVAVNIPANQSTMASLAELFGSYGAVASLQVVKPRPGGGVPPSLQRLSTHMPELATTTCAIVEYENVWGAASALHHLASSSITLHILRRSRRPSNKTSSPTPTPTPRGRGWYESGVPAEELRQRLKGTWSRLRQNQADSSGSDVDDGPDSQSWRRNSCGPNLLTAQRQAFHHHHHHHHHFHRKGRGSSSTPTTPATQRRHEPQGVTRTPRGPDGTQGFTKARV